MPGYYRLPSVLLISIPILLCYCFP